MARRYWIDPLPEPGPVELPEDLSHHLTRVLRNAPGESILLFDGRGRTCPAVLGNARGKRLHATAGPPEVCEPEPVPRIHLAVSLPKGARADTLIEQATALGVHAIHPVLARRSENRHHRLDRWRRIAAASAGQCARDFLPEITPPQPLPELLGGDLPRERFLAHRDAPALDRTEAPAAALLVGPEGGFTADEIAMAEDHGFLSRSLGPRVLRTETAAAAGIVLLARAHGTG